MKTYIRILGIVSLITCLGLLGLWAFGLFQLLKDEPEDLWILLLLAIPLYSLIHFVIFHRFGFNYKSDFTKPQRVTMVSLAIVFGFSFLLLILPNIVRFNATLKQNEKLAEPLELGIDTTAYGYSADLTIKYLDGKIHYKFKTQSDELFQKDNQNIPTFTVELYDKDGFLIDRIAITKYSRNIDDSGNISGITANSNEYINSDDYKRIAKWGLGINK